MAGLAVVVATASLVLHGGHPGPAGTSCGVSPDWQYFSRGGTVSYSVRFAGMPVGTVLRVVVERCYTHAFREVETFAETTKAGGRYTGSFPVSVRSDCFVQVVSGSRRSNRVYFRVR
jgi:hypothetical protein